LNLSFTIIEVADDQFPRVRLFDVSQANPRRWQGDSLLGQYL
jgi:hypothetical protein